MDVTGNAEPKSNAHLAVTIRVRGVPHRCAQPRDEGYEGISTKGTFTSREGQVVLSVTGPYLFGPDSAPLIGCPIDDFFDDLCRQHGRHDPQLPFCQLLEMHYENGFSEMARAAEDQLKSGFADLTCPLGTFTLRVLAQ